MEIDDNAAGIFLEKQKEKYLIFLYILRPIKKERLRKKARNQAVDHAIVHEKKTRFKILYTH